MAQREHDDLLTLAFAMESNPGGYAFLIGAGVSKGANLPTAWEVINDLTGQLAALEGAETTTPVDWYTERFGEDASYSAVLGRMGRTRLERQRLLRTYFERPGDSGIGPAVAHHSIADLVRLGVVKVIVTLNFDRMIETSLRQAGIEPVVVVTGSEIKGLPPLHTLDCCVIHLHGDYLDPESMLNTEAELREYSTERAGLLKRVLDDYGLIAVGWSADHDDALRNAIAADYPNRYTFTWIEPADQTQVARDLAALKKAALVRTTANDGIGRLANAVQALRTRHARHPMTLATAVETAKRELDGSPVRVHLHDVLADEFTRLHELEDIKNPSGEADAPFEDVVARIDEASTVVCGLIASLAFYGDAASDKWWIGELRRFAIQGDGSGYTNYLQRRLIAGVSMFYSAGVAAVANERFELLAKLFSTTHHDQARDRTEPFADVFRGDRIPVQPAEGTSRPLAVVKPILNEVLRAPQERLDDWWQRFELLRSTHLLLNEPTFKSLFDTYRTANEQHENGLRTAEEKRSSNDPKEEAYYAAAAEKGASDAEKALNTLVGLVRVGGVHVQAVDNGPGARWGVPVVRQLKGELRAESFNHPLIVSEFAPSLGSLNFALEGVDIAFGDAARQARRLYGRVLPSRIWLDQITS